MDKEKKPAEKPNKILEYEELEQRILFSADLIPGSDAFEAEEEDYEEVAEENQLDDDTEEEVAELAADSASLELVLVNENVSDYEQLIAGLEQEVDRAFEVIVLDAGRDGIDQVSEILGGRNDLGAVHFVTHGDEGRINLGSSWLSSDTLEESGDQVAAWGDSLREEGDIIFYGCNVAASGEGRGLLDGLSWLTGADVAASDDPTGQERLGGDWELEYRTGTLESSVAVSSDAQRDWEGLLSQTIHTSYENAPDTNEIKSDSNYGQTFSYDSGNGTYNVNQLSLLLNKDADATAQNITVYLRSSWDGSDLGSATIASSSLSTTANWETFDIGNLSLTDNATYYIRVTSDSADGKIWIGCDSSGTYADGDMLDVNGSALSGEDLAFRVAETTGTSSTGTAIWAESGSSTPETSHWNGTSFDAEGTTISIDQWKIIQGAESTTRDERIIVGVDDNEELRGMIWDGSNWSAIPLNPLDTVSNSYWWGFDVAYEQSSGDAMLVWNNGSTGSASISYSVWDGSSWSTPTDITTPLSGEAKQIQLAANPNSDEMVLIASNGTSQDYAMVWDGSSWGNSQILSSSGSGNDRSDIYVTYESQSGDAMVAYGKGAAEVNFRLWDGTNWGSEGTLTEPSGVSGNVRWTTMASDPNSDRIAIGVLTYSNEVWMSVWDGSSWETSLEASSSAPGTTYPVVAVAFESSSGQALATYGEGSSSVRYRTWSDGSGWSSEQTGPDIGNTPQLHDS